MIPQFALAAVGIWLMAAPAVLDYGHPAAASHRTAGPAMAAIGFLAAFAITRGLRWLNVLTGLWLVTAPWLSTYPTDATVNSVLTGLAALALAPIGRPDQRRYGGGWVTVLRGP